MHSTLHVLFDGKSGGVYLNKIEFFMKEICSRSRGGREGEGGDGDGDVYAEEMD